MQRLGFAVLGLMLWAGSVAAEQTIVWQTATVPTCTPSSSYAGGTTAYLEWGPAGTMPAGMTPVGYIPEQQIGAGAWTPLPSVNYQTTRTTVGPLRQEGMYTFRVKTRAKKGTQTMDSAYGPAGVPAPCLQVVAPATQPLVLSAKPSCGATCVELRWNATAPMDRFTMQRSNPQDPSEAVQTNAYPIIGSSANDDTVRAGRSYCYQVAPEGSTVWSNKDCLTLSP